MFYFGSALGDTGNGDTTIALVDSTDGGYVLTHPASGKFPATITNIADFNRDKAVDSTDGGIVLAQGTGSKNGLVFLNIAAVGPFAPDGSAAGSLAVSVTNTPDLPPSDTNNSDGRRGTSVQRPARFHHTGKCSQLDFGRKPATYQFE